ncbi:polysaccharide lyase 6 family protein [Vibrio breoganii]|uniref:polysaccharide lyase 6 family protein n=1 Tax=Vibrio breoganii TaxID=553239 RepID=UPI0021C34787|nr:polysaccharide lyase 6 family protein [Vibrio breoganii]MDN3718061.1 polysaccharide lyase 6 family protein [Vibrio breoganii]
MNKSILSILIALAIVGCNDSSQSSQVTGPDNSIPGTPLEPSVPVDPDESIPGTPLDPSTPIISEVPFAKDMPQGVKTLLNSDSSECTEYISEPSIYDKAMSPGDVICIDDGTYSEAELVFGGQGTEEAPIKVRATNPGQVTITGETKIVMGGEYVQLHGLIFKGGESASSKLLETRFSSAELCNNCRISENVFINIDAHKNLSSDKENGVWLALYGKHNWIDHNIFSGKTTGNPIVSLVRESGLMDEGNGGIAEFTTVYANYFANRPPTQGKLYAGSSDNDYEAIRTGLSETHHYNGNSFVIGNLFERIQGEAEVISNKASKNVIAQNTVRNSYGSITNRHGHQNNISNNFIFGDGYPYSGGLRLVDDGHIVTNNYIEGARYKSTTHHGGIVLLGTDGASDGGNGYQPLENVHVAFNTVVDSINSINIDGGGKSKQPEQIYFANNIVDKAIGPVFVETDRGWASNSVVVGNIVDGESFADTDKVTGSLVNADLVKGTDGLYRPSNSSSIDATEYDRGEFIGVTSDMDGLARNEITLAGADDITNGSPLVEPLNYDDVGPQSYSFEKPKPVILEIDLKNYAFADGTEGWLGNAPVTDLGAFSYNSSLVVVGEDQSAYQEVTLTPNTKHAVSAFVKGKYNISVGEHSFDGDVSNTDYQLVIHEFTTGATETSGQLSLALASEVTLNAGIQDGDLGQWRSDGGSSDFWLQQEGSSEGLGDVGSSGDSAFNDEGGTNGSARIRFKAGEDTYDFTSTPGLSQKVSGIPMDTPMTYSLYYCDNKGDDSVSTLHYGVKDSEGNIISEARAHIKDLDDAPEGSVKSCFKQVTLEFDSASNSDVEVFAYMEIDTSVGVDELLYQVENNKELEVRIDEFDLTYQGTPDTDEEAYFDEVRLIKRTDI